MVPSRRHWCLGVAVALIVHVGAGMALVGSPEAPTPPPSLPHPEPVRSGLGGIEIALGPPVVEAAPSDPAPPPPSVETEAAKTDDLGSEPPPPPAPTVAPSPATDSPAVVTAAPPTPKPRSRPVVPRREKPAVAEKTERADAEDASRVDRSPPAPAAAAEAAPEAVPPSGTVPPDPAPPAGASGDPARAASEADAASIPGPPGTAPDYEGLLQAWLEKHKRYPSEARLRRQQGTALLRFVIDRDGRVLSHRLDRSSGHAELDREVEAMLQRAQPLPGIPEDMRREELELVVPVQFFLRGATSDRSAQSR